MADMKELLTDMREVIQKLDQTQQALDSALLKLEVVKEALEVCINTLENDEMNDWRYMEGSQIYTDFRNAAKTARAALKTIEGNN